MEFKFQSQTSVSRKGRIPACVTGRIRVLRLERPPPFLSRLIRLGPIVRKAVSANLGLKFQLGFDFSCTKAYIRANFLCAFILVSEAKLKETKYRQQNSLESYKTTLKIYIKPVA